MPDRQADQRLPPKQKRGGLRRALTLTLFILAGYGWLASRARRIATDNRYARWTDRIAGVLVLGAAALVLSVTA